VISAELDGYDARDPGARRALVIQQADGAANAVVAILGPRGGILASVELEPQEVPLLKAAVATLWPQDYPAGHFQVTAQDGTVLDCDAEHYQPPAGSG
jgi:hypothetical protein